MVLSGVGSLSEDEENEDEWEKKKSRNKTKSSGELGTGKPDEIGIFSRVFKSLQLMSGR